MRTPQRRPEGPTERPSLLSRALPAAPDARSEPVFEPRARVPLPHGRPPAHAPLRRRCARHQALGSAAAAGLVISPRLRTHSTCRPGRAIGAEGDAIEPGRGRPPGGARSHRERPAPPRAVWLCGGMHAACPAPPQCAPRACSQMESNGEDEAAKLQEMIVSVGGTRHLFGIPVVSAGDSVAVHPRNYDPLRRELEARGLSVQPVAKREDVPLESDPAVPSSPEALKESMLNERIDVQSMLETTARLLGKHHSQIRLCTMDGDRVLPRMALAYGGEAIVCAEVKQTGGGERRADGSEIETTLSMRRTCEKGPHRPSALRGVDNGAPAGLHRPPRRRAVRAARVFRRTQRHRACRVCALAGAFGSLVGAGALEIWSLVTDKYWRLVLAHGTSEMRIVGGCS